ncbi:MAG: hypothetical protein KZQ88_17040 [Candidatus Thiodiazotropha sp. (ex Dulcina madagascariensis)]|nr:hypothetical protein [Candidatus Thiodiazotropha sp. (ex Epidulcina cf. delphinae)]MCU7924398.1 hypothetical protein [Candidatus Thiodiazotropha sp. (ex Dulcina madagascariensis)]MCU7924877.1 hypothetical protein [Candidatus Thiodiazotropha sp. (ex Dulcina madagascariensis)]
MRIPDLGRTIGCNPLPYVRADRCEPMHLFHDPPGCKGPPTCPAAVEIIEHDSGRIRVESEKGKGAEHHFTLPA